MDLTIGKRLKDLRKAQGLRQEDVAKQLCIARSTYVGYENETSQPDLDTLKQIAIFFQVSTDYLLGVEEYEYKNDEFIQEVLYLGKQLNVLNRAIIRGKMAELIKEQQSSENQEKNIG
ncbi:MAG: helix-turn-helix domain-containing protein [Lachnospiraceae bacterium]